ncbi:unnamed protein product [Fusarium equiseti]|uniref:Uncharacterized protein n=1 Tax=Fusarium equiseti TaxID=61235 RepID=A0A8J2ISX6_FUSEQ|nr:unnamed protein product [Fusarium equiseti]
MGEPTSEPLCSEDENAYLNQYQTPMKLEDLDMAIENLRKSVDYTPEGSHCEVGYHANPGLTPINRHRVTSKPTDLEEGVQEGVDCTPEEDPKKSERVMCLALHYDARYQI